MDPGKFVDLFKDNAAKIFRKTLPARIFGVSDYQCSRILDANYRRHETVLDETIELDDVGMVPKLVEIGEKSDLS